MYLILWYIIWFALGFWLLLVMSCLVHNLLIHIWIIASLTDLSDGAVNWEDFPPLSRDQNQNASDGAGSPFQLSHPGPAAVHREPPGSFWSGIYQTQQCKLQHHAFAIYRFPIFPVSDFRCGRELLCSACLRAFAQTFCSNHRGPRHYALRRTWQIKRRFPFVWPGQLVWAGLLWYGEFNVWQVCVDPLVNKDDYRKWLSLMRKLWKTHDKWPFAIAYF